MESAIRAWSEGRRAAELKHSERISTLLREDLLREALQDLAAAADADVRDGYARLTPPLEEALAKARAVLETV